MKISLQQDKKSKFLKKNKEYTVFAIYLSSKIEYLIMSDEFGSFPISVESDNVLITDNRISKYWVFGDTLLGKNVLSFPEWANNKMFYQELVEGTGYGDVWKNYFQRMESEFADNTIKLKANELDPNWVQCAECLNAWEEMSSNEVIVCPSCNIRQLSPNVIGGISE